MAAFATHALDDMDAVIEIDVVGQIRHLAPNDRRVVGETARTGASSAALVHICEWQVMQV